MGIFNRSAASSSNMHCQRQTGLRICCDSGKGWSVHHLHCFWQRKGNILLLCIVLTSASFSRSMSLYSFLYGSRPSSLDEDIILKLSIILTICWWWLVKTDGSNEFNKSPVTEKQIVYLHQRQSCSYIQEAIAWENLFSHTKNTSL